MAAKTAKQPTDRVTVRLPVAQIQQMQALVDAGMYRNTTDVVYNAVKALLMSKGGEAKVTIEAQKGLLQIQEELAKIAQAKRALGLQ
jgi:Arc/MetJ-type ribon-helix-helix transcriptional regulator